jgi:hypothetical protein
MISPRHADPQLLTISLGQRLPFGQGFRNVTTAEEAATVGATQRELPED